MNELTISNQYPASNFNLLGNTSVMVKVPDIKSPVVQVVQLDPNPDNGDVYIQEKAFKDKPAKYAITKNGLKKLGDGAGIKMISSRHVVPSTCQKCVAVNRNSGQVVQCGNCENQDVAYLVTISVPQLTGEVLTVEDTHEIIVKNTVVGMTDKQKAQFMKHLPQICEAKALNGAIRTALHIKGTYTLQELQKPFVVAYLVPNLDNPDVKKAALSNLYNSSENLFGTTPDIHRIETKVPEVGAIEASDGEEYDEFIDGTYTDVNTVQNTNVQQANSPTAISGTSANCQQEAVVPQRQVQTQQTGVSQREMTQNGYIADDLCCDKCGEKISERVYEYSINKFGMPLCIKCQRGAGK